MAHCANVAEGENCLFGIATQNNYKTLTAACLSAGHSIISEAPIDINIAKQLNILICDMQFPADKIVIHHATGALGYGLEYTYSIMERTRLAGLSGDKMLSMPMVSFVGQEAWRTKEAKTGVKDTGVLWEIATAAAYLNSGADILVINHPKAAEEIKKTIGQLCNKITEIYPEIGECGIDIDVRFDADKKAWVVDLKKGSNELIHYLDIPEAEDCMEGNKCVPLGLEIAQLRKNIEQKQF